MPYPWVRVEERCCEALQLFLEAFYQQHHADYDHMLMIEHLLDDEYMLRSHGAISQDRRDPSERAEKLAEYQREMQCFAEFLKDKFFEESEETNDAH